MPSNNTFICGCTKAEKSNYSMDFDPRTGFVIVRRDSEGYEICPEHGMRLYGWRSHFIETPIGDKIDYSKKGTDDEINIDTSELEDRRDNRDPEFVYSLRV